MITIQNKSGEIKALYLREFQIDETYAIPDAERKAWGENDDVIAAIASGLFLVANSSGAISSVSDQLKTLRGDIVSVSDMPPEPKNIHAMRGFCTDHEFTPESDGAGGFLPVTKDTPITSDTHQFVRFWGVKFRTSFVAERDRVKVQMVHPEYGVISQYAEWSPWVEDGKIMCPRPPDGASGKIPVGIILRLIYVPTTADRRFIAANWIASHKDGEEI